MDEEDKYETIEEFKKVFHRYGCECAFEYNGKEYQTNYDDETGGVSISLCDNSGKWWLYATLDEMLDNFKADDGKTMREFILDVEVAS